MNEYLPRSIGATGDVIDGPLSQRAHREHVAQSDRLQAQIYQVTDDVWTVVGNGLSNQTFVRGPEGLIAIDTGESVEEMTEALDLVREHCDDPVAAVMYTHFHYVAGTEALRDESLTVDSFDDLPIWGHADIPTNRQRTATEISAAYGRGLVHQFGLALPADGPDGLVNVGLGHFFRSPDHAPFTPGFIPPTHTLSEPMSASIAGLDVEITPAPSDADDSVTIWFRALGVCVNNIVWPALFNVFPIRGEEYRDPRVLLTGLDHVLSLGADYLVGAHGPPLSGRSAIVREVTRSRDSIQFLWDQTVRGINRGLTMDELTAFVQLPDVFDESYFTQQLYGLAEHHVRQIHIGLQGWFDGLESSLFPLPLDERHRRMIDGFGGRSAVAEQARGALEADDLRWALELATWLVRSERGDTGRVDGGSAEERALLAEVLRAIGQRTTSANIRNWTLTRAGELDGTIDIERLRTHRIGRDRALTADLESVVHTLRVMLDPGRACDVDTSVAFAVDGETAGLHIRNCIAAPSPGTDADVTIRADRAIFADVVGGRATLAGAVDAGNAAIEGDREVALRALGCFDHPAFASPPSHA